MIADVHRMRTLARLAATLTLALAAAVALFLSSPSTAQELHASGGPGKPGTPTVTRTEFSGPSAPALDVTWAAPGDGAAVTAYRATYRKKGDANWTWTHISDPNNRTLNITNLEGGAAVEAGAVYEVRIQAVSGSVNSEWSDTGEGTANRPPTASSVSFLGGTLGMGGSFTWHETQPLGSGAFFTDADGDTLTYSASAQHPALLGVSLSGAAGSAVLTANLLNQGSSKVNYVATDPYGGSVTRSATIGITAKTAREVAENSAGGTNVGTPVAGTPYNGVALTYTLTGNAADSDLFVIDSATGQISVAQAAPLDYETDDEYRETETWNDQIIAKFYRGKVNYTVDGHNAVIDVIIKVTDESPGKPSTPSVTRTTFSEPSAPALDVNWTAPSANGLTITGYEARYRVEVADGETPNAWTNYTDALDATATSLNLPGLDAGDTYEAQVRAVARDGGDADIALSVSPASFNEGASAARITVTATRQGTSGAATVSLRTFGGTADDGTDFTAFQWPSVTIPDGQASGSATVTFTGWNDTEVEGSESLIISGTAAGLTVGKAIVTIIDDELPGPVITGWEFSPWSDTGEGTANTPPNSSQVVVADHDLTWGHSAADSDPISVYFGDADSDTLSYSASSEYPGVIRAGTDGDPAKLWYVAVNPASATITYAAQDPYGGYFAATFEVTGVANEVRSVAENSAAGTHVGRSLGGTPYDDGDPETDDALTHTMTGEVATSGLFVLDSSSGQLSVAQGATLDHETKASYTGKVHFTVQGQAAVINLTVNVTDVEAGKPGTPTVTRTEFSEPTDPALDVTWTAPPANGLTITGYKAQYRKKAAQGEDPAGWTAYGGTLGATATTFNLPNLEAGATYEAQVRAVTSEEGAGPWSDTGEGKANTPPNTNNAHMSVPDMPWGISSTPHGLAQYFGDADGDTLSYSTSSEYPGVIRAWIEGTDGFRASAVNPSTSVVTYGAHDPYGGYVSRTVSVTGVANETRSVAENSAAGTHVGRHLGGTPYDDGDPETDDALTHTMTGEVATSGLFALDSSSAHLSVKAGATLDHETKASYTGKVHFTVQGQAAVINLTVNVTDVEAGKPAAPTLTRTEFNEPTDPALDVTWTAPPAAGLTITGYKAQHREKVAEGETANAWTAYTYTNAQDETVSLLPATTTSINLPDLEAGATYEVQVRAVTSEEGEGPWSDTGEGTANRPPTTSGADLAAANVAVGSTGSYAISGKFTDADGDTLTYSASSQYPGVLTTAITGTDSDTLAVTAVNPAGATVTYGASDGYGGYVSRTVAITGRESVTRSVAENAAAGTAVGAPVTGTPHGTETLTYTLSVDATTAFVIDSATGQISVAQGATLNHETTPSYTGQVRWTVQGQTAAANLTINVTDVETGTPGTPTLSRTEFGEPTDPALDVSWTAAPANGLTITGYKAQYRKKAAQGEGPADWTAYTGTLSATATSLNLADLDAGATYEVQVQAVTSEEGEGDWSDTGEGTANTPPAINGADLAAASVAVGSTGSYAVSNKFTDTDNDTLTYSASSQYPGVLTAAITGDDADTLTVTPVNPAVATVTYGASDGYGGYATRTVTITGTASVTRSISESSSAGTDVGDPITGTPHGEDTLSYSLTGDATAAFAIDSSTGQISVKQGATLDYETTSSYTGQVTWTVQGQTATVSLTIELANASAPDKPDAPTATRSPTAPTTTLDVAWTAPADNGSPITDYDVQYRVSGTQDSWSAHAFTGTGTSTTLTGLTANTTYEVQVRASNAEGAGVWSDSGEGSTAAENLPPQFSKQASAREVPENSPGGTAVGDPVTAVDHEGHTLTYALKTASSLFTVDSATGQISVKQGASLDYEAAVNVYTVVVEASDGLSVDHADDGHIVDAETTVRISVTDENEAPSKPDAPSVTRSSASPTSSLRVTWTAPDMTGKPPVTSYTISYGKKGESQWTERSLTGLQTRATLTGLEPGTTYEVSVKASNDEGSSRWSDSGEGSTARPSTPPPDDTPPEPPVPPGTPTPTPPGTPTPAPPGTPTPVPPGTPTPTPPGTPTPTPPGTPTPTPGPPGTPTPEPTSPGNTPTPEPGTPGTPSPGNAPSGGSAFGFSPGEGQPGRAQREPLVTGASAPTPTPTAVTGAPTATPTPTPTPTPEPAALPAASTMPTTGVPPSAGSGPAVVSAYASGFADTITDDGMTASSILIPLFLFLLLLLLIALLRLLKRRAVRRPRRQVWVTPEVGREHRPVVTRDTAPYIPREMPRLRPEWHAPAHRPASPAVSAHRPASPAVSAHRPASPHVPPGRPASPHVPPSRPASPSILASILDSHYRENGARLGGE